MARKEFMRENLGVFSINETIIGNGGNNRRLADVQLIQFFLRQFFLVEFQLFKKLPKDRFNTGVITIDGKFGPQTGAGIFEFQKFVQRSGRPIKVDGLVNVATAENSAITNTTYTILFLNKFFQDKGDLPEFHGNLENHPDILALAPELQAELSASDVGDQF